MHRWLLLALTLLVLLAGTRPAHAYTIAGARWPGSPARITYYEATPKRYSWPIAQAAAAWNTSGVHVRFVRVKSRSSAHVIITRTTNGLVSGYATIGYAPHASINLNMGHADKWTFAGVVAHEMGHILGLNHVHHICAVMTPITYENCKPVFPPKAWQWRCRMLQKDDLAGAQHLYGGKAKLRRHMFCDKAPKVPAVRSMAVTQSTTSPLRIAQVTLKLPGRRVQEVSVLRREGVCPTGPDDVNADFVGQVSGKPRATVSLYDDNDTSLPAGKYCYRAWTFDEWFRAGGANSAQLDYTGPPPVPVANVTAVSQNTVIHPGDGEEAVFVDVTVNTPSQSWIGGAAVVMKQGSCPADHNDGTVLGAAAPGAGKHLLYGSEVPAAGSWCVAAFTADSSLRYAAAGATVTFVYTPPSAPAPTNGHATLVGSDEHISWTWPTPAPLGATIARFDGACPGTITRDDIDNAGYVDYVDGSGAAAYIDYGPSAGTYCFALYDMDEWGYFSSVLKIQYTVP